MMASDKRQNMKMSAGFQVRAAADAVSIINMSEPDVRKMLADVISPILEQAQCTMEQRNQAGETAFLHFSRLLSDIRKELQGPDDPFRRVPPATINTVNNTWARRAADFLDPVLDLVETFSVKNSETKPAAVVIQIPTKSNVRTKFSNADGGLTAYVVYNFPDFSPAEQMRRVEDLTETMIDPQQMSEGDVRSFRKGLQETIMEQAYRMSAHILLNNKIDIEAYYRSGIESQIIGYAADFLQEHNRLTDHQRAIGNVFPNPRNG